MQEYSVEVHTVFTSWAVYDVFLHSFMSCAVVCMSHSRASQHSAQADVWSLQPAVLPGCPSILAKRMSELSVGYISIQADMEWSWPWSWSSSRNFWEKIAKYGFRFCSIELVLLWLCEKCNVRSKPEFFCSLTGALPVCVEIYVLPSIPSHLERLSVFALTSPLPEKSLLFLFLLLLLQSPDVLLKTNEGILFVHICEHITNIIKIDN